MCVASSPTWIKSLQLKLNKSIDFVRNYECNTIVRFNSKEVSEFMILSYFYDTCTLNSLSFRMTRKSKYYKILHIFKNLA